jgi:hypothetical protein
MTWSVALRMTRSHALPMARTDDMVDVMVDGMADAIKEWNDPRRGEMP